MPHAALSPVELALVPGRNLGPFELGDSLWHILDYLRMSKTTFPKIEVQWNEENAITSPVIVDTGHLLLVFPPTPAPSSQLLQKIVLKDLQHATDASPGVKLVYKGRDLAARATDGSERIPLDRGSVARVFGPTIVRPGCDQLIYPGVAFEVDPMSRPAGSADQIGTRSQSIDKIVVFPSSSRADTAKNGRDLDKTHLLADYAEESAMPATEVMNGTVQLCQVQPGRGITLMFYSAGGTTISLDMMLDETTTQDLLCELGPPLRKYWKEDSRITNVWEPAHASSVSPADNNSDSWGPGCWWNYFQHGLDFLIDDEGEGLVRKIMVHSNIPGSALFQRHARCPWVLETPDGTRSGISTPLSTFASLLGSKAAAADMASQAMSHDRTGEGSLADVEGIGPSRMLALPGLVVEEAETGGITSVLVCST